MRTEELVRALRRMKVEAGSLVCVGCGHEHSCGIHGCAVIREAADRLEWVPVAERLPESGVPVLINYIGNFGGEMHPDGVAVWMEHGCWWWEGSLESCCEEVNVHVTHWMPLPEAPEVE